MEYLSNILRSMRPMLDPTEDFLTVVAAEEQMGVIARQRQKEMEEISEDLNGA